MHTRRAEHKRMQKEIENGIESRCRVDKVDKRLCPLENSEEEGLIPNGWQLIMAKLMAASKAS